ncbi:MAG: RND transporter [Nitrospirae bacterium CG18_big_fil_WC_8_21_14_2_50_70_55]|nr:efflux transporter outer membrane subunit [Deltaproteobacteria bacterium]OIP66494.1 MAG: hypothetical protein AUK30_02370 [Nitrospirae bacterium CG2_30_70_394]PIQ06909.1 MAG: RND transporter [Nitrospirae bacterium CG18_big_fil_WC_8_21_14_2_50_70_55]PIU79646.1 MAG: RND transporter [Nitrospirae bacterium CG06_land_8_20_14_3_00_70_43]PIW83581.1 MAG: RND transporter [Nitrospirae bacterium CG_4_8_14_3_um_filter_70_85]PIX82998.1 MAG: RND transporter [Nitrospirae bacterium CG_4_10_14_3_um_filter_7
MAPLPFPRRFRDHALAAGWAIALGVSGCAGGPDSLLPAGAVPAAWSQAVAGEPHPAEDLSRWWRRLDDPLLSDLVRQAMANSPDLQGSAARLDEARARRAVAGATLLPAVTATPSASRTQASRATGGSGARTLYSAGFDARWEADLFGGLRGGAAAAQADLEASQASLHGAQVSLAAEVARNYVELRTTQSRLTIVRANLASQVETVELTEWRTQAGLATVVDVDQARTRAEQTRAQLPGLESALAAARHRLAILLGKPPGSLDRLLAEPGAIPVVPEAVGVAIPADTLRQRPDVRVAERQVAAAAARRGVAQANRYPTLTLSGSLGLQALTVGGLSGGEATTRSLLAQVAAPIFDAGRLRQEVRIQDALLDQARAAYEAAVLTALEEVENGLVALANGRHHRQALQDAAAAAARAATLTRSQYAAGLVDFQTVLDTQTSRLAVDDALATSEGEVATALIQLYKALGGGWDEAGGEAFGPTPSQVGEATPPEETTRTAAAGAREVGSAGGEAVDAEETMQPEARP